MKTFFHSIFAGLLAYGALPAADSVVLTLPDQVTCSVPGEIPCAPADQILTQRIDTLSIGLLPVNGQIHGPAGSTIGWGFTLSWNTSGGDWLRVQNSLIGNVPVNNSGYLDIIGSNGGPASPQDAVPPNSQWTQNFNLAATQGAGGVTLLADCETAGSGVPCADQGSADQGNIIFVVSVYDGDPTAGGNLLGTFNFGNCASADPTVCAQGSTAYTTTIDYAGASAPPTISFATIPDQVYGVQPVALSVTPSANFPVAVTSATPSVCAVSGSAVTILTPGVCTLTATQTGNFQYGNAAPAMQSFNIIPATATISFNAASLTQAYTGSGITASFITTPAGLGTIVTYDGGTTAPIVPGTHQIAVAINDPNYQGYMTAALTINPLQPAVTWNAPAAITYLTALSATQLNATANVPGTFYYTQTAGTVLTAGTQSLQVTFVPTNPDYGNVIASTNIQVNKVTPTIIWPAPAAITFGGALGSGQLNATASVPGTFVYTPPAGTVLQAGNGQTLSATFTPTDTVDYTTASASTTINVNPATAPATPANLVLTNVLTRSGSNVVVKVTIANTGGTAAASVSITSVKVGANTATPLPQSLGTIAAGGSAQATFSVPGTVGTSGAASSLTVSGTYTGGTVSSSARITLP